MNQKTIYRILLGVIFLVMFISLSRYLNSLFRPPFDFVDICSHVIDGDTFDVSSGNRIRLADVDTPERGEYGYEAASNFLGDWIYGKEVYLDVDEVYVTDTTGTRIVCVVYVETDDGVYVNVNQALLDANLAVVSDYSNEFNPALWSSRVYDLSTQSLLVIIGASFVTSIIVIFVLNRMKNQATGYFKRIYTKYIRRENLRNSEN